MLISETTSWKDCLKFLKALLAAVFKVWGFFLKNIFFLFE